ncbi:NAD-dependent epimerase/dehydratase family protein [Shewanella oncorhynchi]|uniref:NAD-dependent epimerase/dehydratase family protein n=1 Tax=Shewanella oncorhynchi TaxID=2726434 RepID=UPI003D7A8F15
MNKTRMVIVTGASGFIGTHLVNRLLELEFDVIAVTRKLKREAQIQRENLIWIEWSNLSDFLKSIPNTPIGIIHLATAYGRNGESLASVEEANVMQPLQLLQLAVKYNIKKFLNADSFFGKPEFNYQYMRPYIITKDSFKMWGEYIANQTELYFVNMRLEHVYGPGDGKDKFIPYIVGSLLNDKKHIECTDCTQKRDFIYVDDAVLAFITVLNEELPSNYLEFEVGCGISLPIKTFLEKLKSNLPKSKSVFKFGSVPQRENEILDSKANDSLSKTLGWKACCDIDSGIVKLLNYKAVFLV